MCSTGSTLLAYYVFNRGLPDEMLCSSSFCRFSMGLGILGSLSCLVHI